MVTCLSLHEIGIEPNDDGFVEGIQCGRAVAIQEWRHRNEDREYAKLFQRLHSRNSRRRAMRDPARRDRILETLRRYKDRNRDRIRAMERQRRKARYESQPVVNRCEECGHLWEVEYEHKPKRSRFCSKRCRNRWHGKRRGRSRGLRDMSIKQRALRYIAENPGATAREIASDISAKPPSLATCLCRWAKEGLLRQVGRKPARYFRADV